MRIKRRIVVALACVAVVVAAPFKALALDRNAFTFTGYKLQVQVEPQQQRIAVRGTVVLRNDSASPQKNAALQISSSLSWRSIRLGEQALQFVTQPYTSDIDHTGELSEAIVSFPREIVAGGTVELTIGYEGVITVDATRLTRIGVPEQTAIHSDWDQIGKRFTAVRGVGFVAWYPVSVDAGNLSEGDSLFDVIGKWKAKSAESKMHLSLCATVPKEGPAWALLLNNLRRGDSGGGGMGGAEHDPNASVCASPAAFDPLGLTAPAFAMGPYASTSGPGIQVYFAPDHKSHAEFYVAAAEKVAPFVADWVGTPRATENIVELEDPGAAPFETGSMLLTPLHDTDAKFVQLAMVHELAHAALGPGVAASDKAGMPAPPAWIEEGLATFLQGVYREQQDGREAALDFMGLHRAALAEAEKKTATEKDASEQSLLNTATDELIRSKAAWVWWMLRDLVGEDALKRALAEYLKSERDAAVAKNSGHSDATVSDSSASSRRLEQFIEKESKRDLHWLFDDWVYHDRGLPDFHIAAVFTRETNPPTHVTTVTVENLGTAAAEVPVTVLFGGGEVQQKVLLKGQEKQVLRVETLGRPTEVIVNDNSVPEIDSSNNVFKVEAGK